MHSKKIVIIGDAAVGKTNFVRMLKDVSFEKKYFATVGTEVHPYSFDDTTCTIWDIAGQPMYQGHLDGYLNDADIAIVMYDVNRKSTFENIHKYWIPKLNTSNILIVGNKSENAGNNIMNVKTGAGVAEVIRAITKML
jgi:Ras-related protein Rab-11A